MTTTVAVPQMPFWSRETPPENVPGILGNDMMYCIMKHVIGNNAKYESKRQALCDNLIGDYELIRNVMQPYFQRFNVTIVALRDENRLDANSIHAANDELLDISYSFFSEYERLLDFFKTNPDVINDTFNYDAPLARFQALGNESVSRLESLSEGLFAIYMEY